ncbi:MAG: histidine phosphatase family protein [Alphaproteobacteria bacterium]|nr:histidine phosphatase family protein [Alphaproteobacteria bacterium]
MLPATPFYIIRHGQTEANASQIMAGQLNSPLTDLGRAQAEAARAAVEALPVRPRIIVHSHLDRARDTASILNRSLGLPMISSKEISEIFVGEWEGTPYEVSLEPYLKGEDPPGGETHAEFCERVRRGIRAHCEEHDGPVLFVAHGGVMRAIASLYGIFAEGFRNCHLHEFEPDAANAAFPWKVWHHDCPEDGSAPQRIVSPLFHPEENRPLSNYGSWLIAKKTSSA